MFLILQICVFFSGGVALILEAVYQKYLSTLIGSTTPAATIVLVTYFLGISLGALVCPKTGGDPRRRLAFLEFSIALWSIVLAVFFYQSHDALSAFLAAWSDSALTLGLARWLIALLWILPPTMAMGAHLPTLGVFLQERGIATSKNLTRLYALNAAGACTFTLLAPFLFFQNFGLEGTLLISAVMGLTVSAALFWGLRTSSKQFNNFKNIMNGEKVSATSASSDEQQSIDAATIDQTESPYPLWPFILAALSGFMIFALEVLWSHLIASVMGASTYSFSILLAVVLFSLAIAGRHVERAAPSGKKRAMNFIAQSIGTILLSLPITLMLWPLAGRALAALCGNVPYFWFGELMKLLMAYLLIKPVAAAVGRLFPATFHAMSSGLSPNGRGLGWLNMVNSIGCVIGALAANYLLIPILGAEISFELLWGALFIAWIFLRLRARQHAPALREVLRTAVGRQAHLRSIMEPLVGALIIYGLWATGGWNREELTAGYGVYMSQARPSGKIIYFHEDQHSGFVTVVENEILKSSLGRATQRTLLQNGKFDANDSGEMAAQISFGLISSLFAPRLERALVIGLGSGQTAWMIHAMRFKQLDICEMSPGHVEAAQKYFNHINGNVLERPGVTLHLEDGRNFLARTRKLYDAISIEITSIWFSGAANLYSREFYRQLKRRMAPGGILQQWAQLHHLTEKEIVTIFATLKETFAYLEVFVSGGQAVLIASDKPLNFNEEQWRYFVEAPQLAIERQIYELENGDLTKENFLWTRLLDDAQVEAVIAAVPHVINTDRNKWLEFHTPRYYLSRRDHWNENVELFQKIASRVNAEQRAMQKE